MRGRWSEGRGEKRPVIILMMAIAKICILEKKNLISLRHSSIIQLLFMCFFFLRNDGLQILKEKSDYCIMSCLRTLEKCVYI